MKPRKKPTIPKGYGLVNLAHWDKACKVLFRAMKVNQLNEQALRLICGEMTAQEIRSVRAIVNYILRA